MTKTFSPAQNAGCARVVSGEVLVQQNDTSNR